MNVCPQKDNLSRKFRDLVAWIIPKDALSSCFSTQGITWMPHKFNAARRHKFDKAQYRVIHWAERRIGWGCEREPAPAG